MKRRRWPGLAAVWCICAAGVVRGDQIVFRNGDKLTGTIKSADNGKLVIETPMAGTVTADIANLASMTTDNPVTIQLEGGKELRRRVTPATTQGIVTIQDEGEVALVSIKRINPPLPAPAVAPPPVPPSPSKWTGSLKAGALVTRGNSETENFNINFDATRRTEKHRVTTGAGYFFGRQRDPNTGDDNTTTDNWFALGKYDYFFTPKFYGYVQTRVEQDRIAHLDLRVIPGIGVGYQWWDTPTFKFSTEAGVDWVFERYEDGGSNEHFAARAAYHVEKKLNDKVTLFHNFEYRPSFYDISDFNINADAGIRTTLYKNLFTEFRAEWRFD